MCSLLVSKTVNIKPYKAKPLPVVSYEFETWSVTSREEHRLRVFERRAMRRTF
jgi:hypothetical protein